MIKENMKLKDPIYFMQEHLGYTDEEMKKFAKLIKDHGLVCQDVHGTATMEYEIDSFNKQAHKGFVKLLENRIRFCHEVGGDAVVVHPPLVYKPDFEKRVHVSKKALKSVKELCLVLGVTLAIENLEKGDHHVLSDYFQLFEQISTVFLANQVWSSDLPWPL